MNRLDKVSGSLFGLAYGDAFGAPTEFLLVKDILARWPPAGPTDLEGSPARVTDDTQMALFTAEALIRAEHRFRDRGLCSPPHVVHRAYVRWLLTPGRAAAPHGRLPGHRLAGSCWELEARLAASATTKAIQSADGRADEEDRVEEVQLRGGHEVPAVEDA
jgi:hypothetical protein